MDRESFFRILKERIEKTRQESNTPPFNVDKFRELVERIKKSKEGKL